VNTVKKLQGTTGRKEKFGLFDAAIYLILILLAVCFLYPMLHVIAVSFSDAYSVSANKVLILPRGFTLESYSYLLKNDKISRAFINTVYYTAVGTFINLGMTALMAYPLSKTHLTGRGVILKLIMFTMFFGGGTIPTFMLVKDLRLIDTPWALWLPNAIWTMEMLIMISFFRSLPQSLFESAYLDGASEYRIFLQIALPLSKASLASIAMFYFMGHWNSYFIPMMYLNDSAKFPLQLVLRSMLLEDANNFATQSDIVQVSITPTGVKNAVIFITMVPVMIVYPFMQRYFVKGVMIGSIKG
jgi:putative aldouronate transport system permease protein